MDGTQDQSATSLSSGATEGIATDKDGPLYGPYRRWKGKEPVKLQHAFSIVGGRLRRPNKSFPYVATEVRGSVQEDGNTSSGICPEDDSSEMLRILGDEPPNKFDDYYGLVGETEEERQLEQELLDCDLLDPFGPTCFICQGYLNFCDCPKGDFVIVDNWYAYTL